MSDKAKVLVVEDETPIATLLVYLLDCIGCDAEAAWSGENALQLAEAGRFDLITLDVNLPGMSGFEIFKRLKRLPQLKDTPVVFVSGRVGHQDRELAFELGAADYIQKPFDAGEFLARIASFLQPKTAV